MLPYRTNAELAVIAAAFVDDNERNLLFRVYVPSGRLYAAEADKLLTLFHDYLTQVGRFGVRQDGYSTACGQVYEFFGNDDLSAHTLTQHFNDFAKFLDTCVEDPTEAERGLVNSGVERLAAPHLVHRYGKEARRLSTDLRQERETRMLVLRHRFETELLDLAEADDATHQVEQLVEAMVPKPHGFSPRMVLASATQLAQPTININQQIVHAAAGAIVHNIQGTAHFGTEAQLLLSLIDRHAPQESEILTSAVHELEDPDARPVDRLTAKQRLKGFLYKVAQDLEKPAMAILHPTLIN